MTDIPTLVIKAAEYATNQARENLAIQLRTPLDAQSNNLYDLRINGRHLIVKAMICRKMCSYADTLHGHLFGPIRTSTTYWSNWPV